MDLLGSTEIDSKNLNFNNPMKKNKVFFYSFLAFVLVCEYMSYYLWWYFIFSQKLEFHVFRKIAKNKMENCEKSNKINSRIVTKWFVACSKYLEGKVTYEKVICTTIHCIKMEFSLVNIFFDLLESVYTL